MSSSLTAWQPGVAFLFCPGDRPDRYAKALERSDVVLLDLEDAVAEPAKAAAREALAELARTGALDVARTVVRVNGATTPHHAADVAAAVAAGVRRVMVPKAEDPVVLADVADAGLEVVALVESPLGVERAGDLARAPGVVAMMWGGDDLVAGLGGTASRRADGSWRDVVVHARSRVLLAAKAYGRLALDGVHMGLDDVEGLRAQCEDGVAVGFDAGVAIHPAQVPVIRAAYAPSRTQVAWARGLLEAFPDGLAAGVGTYEGRMVDGPVFAQARRVLARAGAEPGTEPGTGRDTEGSGA